MSVSLPDLAKERKKEDNQLKEIQRAIEKGANINEQDEYGNNSLYNSCWYNCTEIDTLSFTKQRNKCKFTR